MAELRSFDFVPIAGATGTPLRMTEVPRPQNHPVRASRCGDIRSPRHEHVRHGGYREGDEPQCERREPIRRAVRQPCDQRHGWACGSNGCRTHAEVVE